MGTPASGFSPYEEWKLRRNARVYDAFRLMGGLLFFGAFVFIAIFALLFAGSRPKRRLLGKGSKQQGAIPNRYEYTDWEDDVERGRNGSLSHPI